MPALKFIETNSKLIHKWKAIEMKFGVLSLAVIPFGGRIISLNYCLEEFLYTNPTLSGVLYDLEGLSEENLKKLNLEIGNKFYNYHSNSYPYPYYGGENTLITPIDNSNENLTELVLNKGHYKIKVDGTNLILTSPICKQTGLRIIKKIHFANENTIEIEQNILNLSNKNIECEIKNQSLILQNSFFYIPQAYYKIKSLTKNNNNEEEMKNKFLVALRENWTRLRAEDKINFHFGTNLTEKNYFIYTGKLSLIKNNFLIMERYFQIDNKAKNEKDLMIDFINHNEDNFTTLQIKSPIYILGAGKSLTQKQIWKFRQISKEDPKAIFN